MKMMNKEKIEALKEEDLLRAKMKQAYKVSKWMGACVFFLGVGGYMYVYSIFWGRCCVRMWIASPLSAAALFLMV